MPARSMFSAGVSIDGIDVLENLLNIKSLFTSDLFSISDFSYYYNNGLISKQGFNTEFSFCLTRSGEFFLRSDGRDYETFNGRVLVEKPGSVYHFCHQGNGAGNFTVFRFNQHIYDLAKASMMQQCDFLQDHRLRTAVMVTNPEIDYLHHAIRQTLSHDKYSKSEITGMTIELMKLVMKAMTSPRAMPVIPPSNKQLHLATIERAKEYLLDNFTKSISLVDLSRYCYVSTFHFSRLFKLFTNYAPHQYLQRIRLKHAETLIRTTRLPITDICFKSGFSRLDYFSAAFTKEFSVSPTKYQTATVEPQP
ncbi:helix-turn-helix domain-containing protein [Flavihumibacter petaseus]|uniref:Putative AraC family transcriptional regulator n=1 Tax=Flavihumibacter petaseus NBRC 106054 TaxID=1220578 RepID=A0A0E9N174_9BACT|nr:AraC family transcriptional regulator [Flavihumibacter petaseus]GAO43386.1 putative AraC family transcriptional regulator [Flavihumibacter petaseus NBRC 106054]